MLKLFKPPPQAEPPNSLSFKGFGLSFSGNGPHGVWGTVVLIVVVIGLLALVPNFALKLIGAVTS